MARKSRLISVSLEEVAPLKEGRVDIARLRSAADQIAHLAERGFRVIAVIGGGSLGEEYVRISNKFSSHSNELEIKSRAAEVSSLLLITAIKNLKIPVNAAPIIDTRRIEEFLGNHSWKVAVLANPEGNRRSSQIAIEIAKKYHTAIIHIANTKQAIDRKL